MIPLLITFATIAGYFTVGFTWSRRMLPRWWEIARREHEDPYPSLRAAGLTGRAVRESVKMQFFFKALIWPILIALNFLSLDKVIDSGDPKKIEADLKNRDKRIRDLERELGIGPSTPTPETESMGAIREMFRFKNGGIK